MVTPLAAKNAARFFVPISCGSEYGLCKVRVVGRGSNWGAERSG